jgi:hypothetical protein
MPDIMICGAALPPPPPPNYLDGKLCMDGKDPPAERSSKLPEGYSEKKRSLTRVSLRSMGRTASQRSVEFILLYMVPSSVAPSPSPVHSTDANVRSL